MTNKTKRMFGEAVSVIWAFGLLAALGTAFIMALINDPVPFLAIVGALFVSFGVARVADDWSDLKD